MPDPVVGGHCSFAFEVKLDFKHIWSWLDPNFFFFCFFVSANLHVALLADLSPLDWGCYFLFIGFQVGSLLDCGHHHSWDLLFHFFSDEIFLQGHGDFCPASENLFDHHVLALPKIFSLFPIPSCFWSRHPFYWLYIHVPYAAYAYSTCSN